VAGAADSPAYPSSCLHPNGDFNPANGSTTVQLAPFDFTPNSGGEYKAWLIAQTSGTSIDPDDPKRLIFSNSDSKTDNFKVKECSTCPPPETSIISGVKCYDANLTGQCSGNPGIQGWRIILYGAASNNTTTDSLGHYSFINLTSGTYGVCEVIPTNATPVWLPTTATNYPNLGVPPDQTHKDFGNVCLGSGGGLTLGFWSNKNGQAILLANDTAWRTLLNGSNLRTANGSIYLVPVLPATFSTAYSNFRTWLLNATATNMAYMLSAQLAAMELNVQFGNVSGASNVYAPGCGNKGLNNNFITVADLMAAAVKELGLHGSTPSSGSGSQYRAYQQCLKNALDAANNNNSFIQPTQDTCDVNYSNLEPSCAP
jgi:hypothetical protein